MPKVEQKQKVIDNIKATIDGAKSIVLVDYRGLTVEQDTLLRKELRESNVTYKVFKNSMMNFAFKGTEFEPLSKHLAGPSAIAISYEDATAGPRILLNNTKKYKTFEFKAGVVEGEYYDTEMIAKIAAIPSRDELLSKLLGSFKSPLSAFARVSKAIADKLEEEGKEKASDIATGDFLEKKEEKPEVKEEAKVEEKPEAKEETKGEKKVEAKKEKTEPKKKAKAVKKTESKEAKAEPKKEKAEKKVKAKKEEKTEEEKPKKATKAKKTKKAAEDKPEEKAEKKAKKETKAKKEKTEE